MYQLFWFRVFWWHFDLTLFTNSPWISVFQITPGCQIFWKKNQPRLVVTQQLKFNIIKTIEMAKQGSHWHRSNASALPYSDNFHRLFLQHKIIRVNEDVRRFIIDRTCPLLWRTRLDYLRFWCSNKILNRYYLTSLTFIPIVLLLYGAVFIRFVTPFNYQLIPQFTQYN